MLATVKHNVHKANKIFDRERMDVALATQVRTAPQGMNREEKRAFMSGKK